MTISLTQARAGSVAMNRMVLPRSSACSMRARSCAGGGTGRFSRIGVATSPGRNAVAIFATSGLSATSTASASPLPAALSCFSAAASVSLLRPEMTTCAPARESSIAPARPIPEPPPVIQATLPASILSGAEEYFRLLLAEAGGLPAALRQYFYAALHRRPRGNAVAPALHAWILVHVHALAIRRAHL